VAGEVRVHLDPSDRLERLLAQQVASSGGVTNSAGKEFLVPVVVVTLPRLEKPITLGFDKVVALKGEY
jgi:hypothetical protein